MFELFWNGNENRCCKCVVNLYGTSGDGDAVLMADLLVGAAAGAFGV